MKTVADPATRVPCSRGLHRTLSYDYPLCCPGHGPRESTTGNRNLGGFPSTLLAAHVRSLQQVREKLNCYLASSNLFAVGPVPLSWITTPSPFVATSNGGGSRGSAKTAL